MTIRRLAAASGTALCLASSPVVALDDVRFTSPSMSDDLGDQIRNNSTKP